jgi:hypothetical protein
MIGPTESHRWGAWRVTWARAFMGPHQVGAASHQPESSPVAGVAPGQTAGAAPQGGDEPTQGAIPSFQKGRLDGRAAWSPAPLLATRARTAKHHAPAALHHPPSRVTDLDDLGLAQGLGGDEPGTRCPPALPPPLATARWTHFFI